MELHTLKPAEGSTKNRKRVGRGTGSGTGKTSGRGHKGQKSRSGWSKKIGFEGGQWPLSRRLPKRGFTNIFRKDYQVVNLSDLVKLDPGEITGAVLLEKGLIRKTSKPVKILGDGNIDKAYNVKVNAFSKSAKEKIEKAGGKAEVI